MGFENNIFAQNKTEKKQKQEPKSKATPYQYEDAEFGGMPIVAHYPGGINVFRRTIQSKLLERIPETEKTDQKTTLEIVIDEQGKIVEIQFIKNVPSESIQNIIRDILFNEVELFSPALNYENKPIRNKKVLPINLK